MEFDKKEFRKKFPNLYKELEEPEEEGSSHIDTQDARGHPLHELETQVASYIRRAHTVNEALEVISYLRKKGEISEEQSIELKRQIEEKGVRSFGPLRTWGHYEKELRTRTPRNLDDTDEEEEREVD
jgi:hypothetical protein